MNKINFVFVGCGAVGKALLEIWHLENLYEDNPITIIEPEELGEWLFEYFPQIKHIQKSLDKDNIKKLLSKIDDHTFVIDVSVNTDCILIIDEVIKHDSMYINTSLENYEDIDLEKKTLSKKYEQFKENTLYYREMLIKDKINKSSSTILISEGANPGIISSLALMALEEVGKIKKIELKEGSYADLAKKFKLRKIHISEVDTQKTELECDDNIFYNTWSAIGAQAEFGDYPMLGYGTHEKETPNLIKPTEGTKHVRFLPEHACDV
jgi:homospermidine synthase